MATTARWVMERAMNNTAGNHTGVFNATKAAQFAAQRKNSTGELIQRLVFAESKSIRTSTIILGVFNVLAALATATSIIYDCWAASKRCNPKFKATKLCTRTIHPAETFPLILAIGIAIQGLAFIGVQATGLSSLFTDGCSVIAQYMWPALFIVPYIQLVFGLECAFRALRKMPFQARGKHAVKMYLVIVVIMLVGTWIPSNLHQQRDTCFATLVWFITSYGDLGLILFSISSGLMLISALIIFFRLSSVNLIDEHQRIAASRMVYYLLLGFISSAFVIPWFVSLNTAKGDIKAAMMATVVINLSGLISGLLQLFLRANTATTSFGPTGSRDRKKHQIRIWGPNELVFNHQLMSPVIVHTPVRQLATRSESRSSLIGAEKGRVISMESLGSPIYGSPTRPNQQLVAAEQKAANQQPPSYPAASVARGHFRKASYSLFPAESSSPDKSLAVGANQEPTSIYDITGLDPPPPVLGASSRGHRRDSSIASSATVQIGLRISHAPTSSTDSSNLPLPLPSTTYTSNLVPRSAARLLSPSPLKIQTQGLPSPTRSPERSSPPLSNSSPKAICVNKTLPPTPQADRSRLTISCPQLIPAVYSPEQKARPELKTTTTRQNSVRTNGTGSPLALLKPPTQLQDGKTDWI
ncbi:uncharacterized protein BP5553_07339 [Venustampulla echinocandica]|uniref:Uncharacterized protein n=1 Tax=Venustampulla echinocandica TaxID=2656787 RepID=A0A370TJ78_9HELO|nr:uncharacterized protein BP5553_07339 [Venustampulla echinocandica]RDL35408.1 hypothetical protein BP5553_07339 [Venustampulla echinocandica]